MIKNYMKKVMFGASVFIGITVNAQSYISDFEINTNGNGDTLALDSNGVWLGDSLGYEFKNGVGSFVSDFNPSFGGYWSGGFSLTNNIDSSTAGFGNNYSTFAGKVYSGDNFATVSAGTYANARVKFDTAQTIQGFYISNTTYAALSMRDGDSFAKVFGADTLPNGADTTFDGSTVTTEDWFKITITPKHGDSLYMADAIDYYLADYRFSDDSQDYILEGWNWVELSSFGDIDGIQIVLSSSDVGSFGMNTPAYFSMDDLVVGDPILEGNEELINKLVSIYPNPATHVLNLKIPSDVFNVVIMDNQGRSVKTSTKNRIDISELSSGIYFVSIHFEGIHSIEKLIIK